MMIEDKLTRNERIRLESLNQSVNSFFGRADSAHEILNRALFFENYIRSEKDVPLEDLPLDIPESADSGS